MICISINQESRRMALVDMLNASRQCDLLEIRLDRFDKAPDLSELLSAKPKPVIMSCRRPRDGGHWEGSEEERLALLRQCIISKADYVEIELDVADQIRRFPPTQRVISYTNLQETPDDIADIYAQARTKNPDVIKLTTLARTAEEAWPLVQILAKATVPTVVVGLGKPGLMLAVLGKKIGAPWTYAALERGMEAYPGQATISALNEVYHYPSIARSTRLIGVTGFGEREYNTVSALNAALHHLELPARCLPLGVGSVRLFRKIMEAVKLAGVVVDGAHQETLLEIAAEQHATAQTARSADVLLHKDDAWSAYHTVSQAAARALMKLLQPRFGDEPLKERMVLVVGVNTLGRAVATELQRRGASLILASRLRKAGLQTAQELGCRFVQFEALYTTMHDVLVVCDDEKTDASGRSLGPGIHAGYLRPGMAVMDLTAGFRKSDLLKEARSRDALIVDPRDMLLYQLELQARLLTGKPVPREVLAAAVPEVDEE